MDDKKRAEILARKAVREQEAGDAKSAHEDLLLELEDRFATDLGARGKAFEITNSDNACGEGPIVLKPASAAAIKLWRSKEGNAPEDAFALAQPCVVYPDDQSFAAMVNRRPYLLERAVAAVLKLGGVAEAQTAGKF